MSAAYRVLARKYRPATFSQLVGQDVLVRTLSNAIQSNRLAHAWLLTGIRGIGKTTTARIIARALNCIGADGNGGPTPEPCGVCTHCTMIAEDRHMDVLEMDAASRTGVGDIRDIIETVQYLPSSARYKVYIIDEVHMLSNNAFNALLKTLEEPPPHVKFIFATTELRKIPVTILSRCQRFDLKRLDNDTMAKHLAEVARKEAVEADAEALQLIAVAAEGSVRDALSLMDQAIAHSLGEGEENTIHVAANTVRDMLGLADKTQSFRLMEPLFAGRVQDAITAFRALYNNGADPALVLQDALDLTHFITQTKLVPAQAENVAYPEALRTRSKTLAEQLSMTDLTRVWQMLLKATQEVRTAPNAMMAAEMAIIRIAHAAELPSPTELLQQLAGASGAAARPAVGGGGSAAAARPNTGGAGGNVGAVAAAHTTSAHLSAGNAALAIASEPFAQANAPHLQLVEPAPLPNPQTIEDIIALFSERREPMLSSYLKNNVGIIECAGGVLRMTPNRQLPSDFATRVASCLEQWTGQPWQVTLSRSGHAPSKADQEEEARKHRIAQAMDDPVTQSVLAHFPGTVLEEVSHKGES